MRIFTPKSMRKPKHVMAYTPKQLTYGYKLGLTRGKRYVGVPKSIIGYRETIVNAGGSLMYISKKTPVCVQKVFENETGKRVIINYYEWLPVNNLFAI